MKSHLNRSRAVGLRTGRATPGLPSDVVGRRSASVGWARFAFPLLVGAVITASAAGPASASPARAFELVSPPAKGGSDVTSAYIAAGDGNAVAYESYSVLGNPDHAMFSMPYVARRGAAGWATTSMQGSIVEKTPTSWDAPFLGGFSADLSTAFSWGYVPFEAGDENWSVDSARVREGVTTWVTPSLTLPDQNFVDSTIAASSADGDHFVVSTSKPMVPGVDGGDGYLYLSSPEGLELASRLPNGDPTGAVLGYNRGFQGDGRALSADGQTVFFTTTSGIRQLYVRRGGVTKLVSANTDGTPGAAPSIYQAAAADGSRVLFSSTSQLTAGAPVGGGLYRYDVETDEVRLMLAGTVTGLMQSSDDLSVSYVVSTDELEPGQGTPNQTKIYRVTDSDVRFVADISSYDNTAAWTWGQGSNLSGVSSDGKRFAFQTRQSLAGANLGVGKQGVYRYDADSDEVVCVSCRPDGEASGNGTTVTNVDLNFGNPGFTHSRVISDDGGLIVFQTSDALLPEDGNTTADVYGYDDDGLHLISGGLPDGASNIIDISEDGHDVFFVTNSSLTDDDTDQGYRDVYTARIGGGFPSTEVPCTASTCDRPDGAATAFTSVIGSTGVFDQPVDRAITAKTTFKVGSITAASRRSWARTGRTRLKVRVSAGARISVTTKRAGKTIAKANASRQSAGTATLTLKLSKSATAQLKRNGRLKLTVTVAVSGAAKASKATVTLVAPKTKKAGR